MDSSFLFVSKDSDCLRLLVELTSIWFLLQRIGLWVSLWIRLQCPFWHFALGVCMWLTQFLSSSNNSFTVFSNKMPVIGWQNSPVCDWTIRIAMQILWGSFRPLCWSWFFCSWFVRDVSFSTCFSVRGSLRTGYSAVNQWRSTSVASM